MLFEQKQKKLTPTQRIQKPTITIWIHGTRFSQKALQLGHRIMRKPYQKLTGKKLPYYHSLQGLYKAIDLDSKFYLRHIAQQLADVDPNNYPFNHSYIFGWSGNLSIRDRKQAGKQLYIELNKLIDQHKKEHGIIPFVRIITHSHGGNVALYLAKNKTPKSTLFINELILLACPVQIHTAKYIHNDIFKNVYSLYSEKDIIQRLDPQGLHKLFSSGKKVAKAHHLFSERTFDFDPKVKQVKIILDGHELFHISFLLNQFVKQLPRIITEIDEWFVQKPIAQNEKRTLRVYTNKNMLKRRIRRFKN